jgi:hypothetical protein
MNVIVKKNEICCNDLCCDPECEVCNKNCIPANVLTKWWEIEKDENKKEILKIS